MDITDETAGPQDTKSSNSHPLPRGGSQLWGRPVSPPRRAWELGIAQMEVAGGVGELTHTALSPSPPCPSLGPQPPARRRGRARSPGE